MINDQISVKNITLIGGDRRQAYMADLLCRHGYHVSVLGLTPLHSHSRLHICADPEEAVSGSRWIVCPTPFHKQLGISLEDLLKLLLPGQALAGGCIPDAVLDYCQKHSVRCHDFMKSEQVAIFNTIATAEGAIAEAILHHPGNLHGEKSLILGYGRCGKTLADKLKGLSSQVSVCARSHAALAQANAFGMDTFNFEKLPDKIHKFQYIFNTIPAMTLDEPLINKVNPFALILDIASDPGGVDFTAAKAAGINACLYPGLPGRYAPQASAGAFVTDLLNQF